MKTYKDEEINNLSVFVKKFKRTAKKVKTFKMSSSSIYVENIIFHCLTKIKGKAPSSIIKKSMGILMISDSRIKCQCQDSGY